MDVVVLAIVAVQVFRKRSRCKIDRLLYQYFAPVRDNRESQICVCSNNDTIESSKSPCQLLVALRSDKGADYKISDSHQQNDEQSDLCLNWTRV